MPRTAFIIATLMVCSIGLADIVTLNDGTRLVGDVKKTDKGWSIITPDGKTIDVAADKVKSIQLGDVAGERGTQDGAMFNLLSLRRSIKNSTDAPAVVERIKRFVESNPGTPAAEDANKDLAVWQD